MNNIKPFIFLLFLWLLSIHTVSAETISATASRTSGVAPLSVFFNADLADSTPTERPFHDYEYSWNFGDSASGTWGTTGHSKNNDKGPVGFHVYETPGTYTATYTARNISGTTVESGSFTITVSDPDTVFSGSNTTCISTDTDFSGCPPGATQITTSSLTTLPTYTTSGKRVLLHRGSSWTAPDTTYPANASSTTVHIGAYGACASTDSQGICSNAPNITVTYGGDARPFFDLGNKTDWRIADITLSGATNVQAAFGGGQSLKQFMALRVKTTGFFAPLGFSNWRTNDSNHTQQNAIVSCASPSSGTYGGYVESDRLAVIGNKIEAVQFAHVMRIPWSHVGVISHNIFSGASIANTNGRHALKMHSPGNSLIGTYAETGGGGVPYPTKFTVIRGNIFGGSGQLPVKLSPQDDSGVDERLSDILFERNKILSSYGIESSSPVTSPLSLSGRYYTIRNNIIDTTSASHDVGETYGIRVFKTSAPDPLGIRIYNNTIYGKEGFRNESEGFSITTSVTDVEIKNNYVSFPISFGPKSLIVDFSGGGVTLSNNILTNDNYFVDPDNVNPLLKDFSITAEAVLAIDQGIDVPVFEDFYGKSRVGSAVDIGASEYIPEGSARRLSLAGRPIKLAEPGP